MQQLCIIHHLYNVHDFGLCFDGLSVCLPRTKKLKAVCMLRAKDLQAMHGKLETQGLQSHMRIDLQDGPMQPWGKSLLNHRIASLGLE